MMVMKKCLTFNLVVMSVVVLLAIPAHAQYKVSLKGKQFIQRVEKCSLERYWDNGAWSIGYGHRMPAGTKQYKKITKAHAIKLLESDLNDAERVANSIVKELRWAPTQSFFDGLVSVIYNCGAGGIYKTDFYKRIKRCRLSSADKVNKQDLHFAVAAIKTARIPAGGYAGGVKARRYAEHKMMLD